jgi:hypothetical protein
MGLATPLGLLALGLVAPLVAWYVLRSRRPSVTVASTYLWRSMDRSVAAAVPWQRFRPDVTFWLVLLALLAGALALAGPFVRVTAELGDHTIVIVDASASMLADEDGPTRLELARRDAEALVDTLGPGQQMSVIEAGSRARVLLSGSSDPAAVRDALRSVRPTHGAADLVDAFTLAAALERPGQTTVKHLLSDGAIPAAAADAAPAGLLVTSVATDRPNLAITRLQAVPVGAGASQVFVQVRNTSPLGARARLTLAVDGTDVVSEEVRLGPRGTADQVLQVSGGDGEVLMARVEPLGETLTGDAATDALGVDDRAFAVLSAPRELSVLIAGPGNLFLEAAFAAVEGVEVTTAERVPPGLAAGGTDAPDVDLLVVDRVAGPSAPTVPTLYVAPTRWPAGVTALERVEEPALTFQAPGHELLTDVDLSGVGVAEATLIDAPALTTVAAAPSGPLVLAGRLDGTPTVLLGFDLLASNLPLQPAWPVLVANTVSWLAGPPAAAPALAGSTVTLPTPVGTTAIEVEPPSGDRLRLDVTSPRFTADQVGIWRLTYEGATAGGAATALAVNPDADESDLARAQPDPVAARDAASAGTTAGASEGRRQLGRDVLLVVLVLAIAEWVWTQGIRPWRRHRRTARVAEPEPVLAPTDPRGVGR